MTWNHLSETTGCISDGANNIKRSMRTQRAGFSQSCHLARETLDTTSTSEISNQSDELSFVHHNITAKSDSFHMLAKSVDSTLKPNSICTTISAISSLGQGCFSGRCLSCSLDGLRAFHPKCTINTDSSPILGTDSMCGHSSSCPATSRNVSRKFMKSSPSATLSSANLNMTFLSSMTLFSTWPGRSLLNNSSYYLHQKDDLLETDSFDFTSEIEFLSEAEAANCKGYILDSKGTKKLANSVNLSNDFVSETSTNSTASHKSSVTEVFCDDLCEDWDDGHENDDYDNDDKNYVDDVISNAVSGDLEINDTEVYVASEQSSVKVHNEVMSACDWSFLQDDKIKTKKKSVKKSRTKPFSPIGEHASRECENSSVSSCSRSHYSDEEDEEDDDGSFDKYFMNEISKKKMNGSYKVRR